MRTYSCFDRRLSSRHKRAISGSTVTLQHTKCILLADIRMLCLVLYCNIPGRLRAKRFGLQRQPALRGHRRSCTLLVCKHRAADEFRMVKSCLHELLHAVGRTV